ncbi:uncharacterized protein LOC126836270 [Adelges cooleyi]|uniref:uncharacterized protein LOC126836270 n=1 Tax=Adelges cooleyi TaxID=133065 RepID=UPI0021809731|nr:uncharacterized protein LOC126836270 [Adelges cooleyi]
MKLAAIALVLAAVTVNVTFGVQPPPNFGPPQHKYRPPPSGGPIPAKYPGGPFGKNEFYSKFNPHSAPPGFRGPPPQPPHFAKFPPPLKSSYPPLSKLPSFAPNLRPGPQFQSKPYQFAEGPPRYPPRPSSKIVNNYVPKPQAPVPEFQRFPVALPSNPAALASIPAPSPPAPLPEKPVRGSSSYIINSDGESGPIKTIPAPNLNPADRPADFEEQLYRAQRPHVQHYQVPQYVQPLDNSITDDKQTYQVTEDPSSYKTHQQAYFAPDPDTVPSSKIPPTTDPNSIPSGKVPLDIALQQHLEKQQSVDQSNTLTPQELYSLLNGNPSSVVQQTAYMVPQPVVYAMPQQPLELQYQPQNVQLQYSQVAAAAPLQYQPQPVQMHYQQQYPAVSDAQQYQTIQQSYANQEQYPQQSGNVYAAEQQPEQYQEQQQQQQQPQQQPEQYLQEQQQYSDQRQNQIQTEKDYEPRSPSSEAQEPAKEDQEIRRDQQNFESIKDQYYTAVGNEQTAGVLAQIAESAANNNIEAGQPQAKSLAAEADKKSSEDDVQVQKSIPLYEGSYSSRRSNQEYADEGDDEIMAGSETVGSVMSVEQQWPSTNSHAPRQFPYNASKINGMTA